MSDASSHDLSGVIAAACAPLQRPELPRVGLRLRLGTSPTVRRLVPTGLAVARAAAKGRAAWENAPQRERALATMQVILGETSRASEIEHLAQRRLVEEAVQRTLFWQPWPTVSLDGPSTANRQHALSSGRRVLLSTCHLGPYFLNMSAFTSVGRSNIAVAAPWFFATPTPDYWGRRLARWRDGVYERGERLACSEGSFPVVKALLEQGEIVLSYFDMPGSSHTRFLGKPVMLASGTARLAFQTEALVLPLRARRAGSHVWTDVFEPLDPRDFTAAEELHRALAKVHERSILELAETLEDPNRAGAWESGATPSEWARNDGSGPAPSLPGPPGPPSALGAL